MMKPGARIGRYTVTGAVVVASPGGLFESTTRKAASS
jgi:hypothetical protein